MLNKHQIFAAQDIKTAVVDMTAEWGGEVKVKVMSLGDKLELSRLAEKHPDKNFILFTVIKCCVDENNKPLFTADDEEMLLTKDAENILKVYKAIQDLSGDNLSQEERAKNS